MRVISSGRSAHPSWVSSIVSVVMHPTMHAEPDFRSSDAAEALQDRQRDLEGGALGFVERDDAIGEETRAVFPDRGEGPTAFGGQADAGGAGVVLVGDTLEEPALDEVLDQSRHRLRADPQPSRELAH